jgi:hypothetical protein
MPPLSEPSGLRALYRWRRLLSLRLPLFKDSPARGSEIPHTTVPQKMGDPTTTATLSATMLADPRAPVRSRHHPQSDKLLPRTLPWTEPSAWLTT